jgi:hypothetical protein
MRTRRVGQKSIERKTSEDSHENIIKFAQSMVQVVIPSGDRRMPALITHRDNGNAGAKLLSRS